MPDYRLIHDSRRVAHASRKDNYTGPLIVFFIRHMREVYSLPQLWLLVYPDHHSHCPSLLVLRPEPPTNLHFESQPTSAVTRNSFENGEVRNRTRNIWIPRSPEREEDILFIRPPQSVQHCRTPIVIFVRKVWLQSWISDQIHNILTVHTSRIHCCDYQITTTLIPACLQHWHIMGTHLYALINN